ncbi:small ribosomal subunit Rsm22 family protein [Streptomyces sp. NPDC020597]|uniref:small ribosomal subunit Rsm22 family protein n=1 Tax=unclassified Streptomyces TaxID=2593676 RepID=UPI003799FB03
MCETEERLSRTTVTKRHGDFYKAARDADWGTPGRRRACESGAGLRLSSPNTRGASPESIPVRPLGHSCDPRRTGWQAGTPPGLLSYSARARTRASVTVRRAAFSLSRSSRTWSTFFPDAW